YWSSGRRRFAGRSIRETPDRVGAEEACPARRQLTHAQFPALENLRNYFGQPVARGLGQLEKEGFQVAPAAFFATRTRVEEIEELKYAPHSPGESQPRRQFTACKHLAESREISPQPARFDPYELAIVG